MKIRDIASFLAVVAAVTVASVAQAGWAGPVKVQNISVSATGDVNVYFTGSSFTGCAVGNGIILSASYMAQTQVNELRAHFLAAKLANSNLEITTSGCITTTGNAHGKLTSVNLY